MASSKFSLVGILVVCLVVIGAVALARFTNPFDEKALRIAYSALLGGIGGATGAYVAKKFGLTKPK